MTHAQVGRLMRKFLREHPEHIPGVRFDDQHGYMMDSAAVLAFSEWAKTNGGNAKKCEEFKKEMKTFLQDNHGEPQS